MRSVVSAEKRALLSADLEKHRPDIVGLTETWLDDSIEKLDILGYQLVSRRDREKTRVSGLNHGGIALYSRVGGILVTHLEDSRVAERSWHVIHTDVGGILLCLWYRPPGADASEITSFDDELTRLSVDTIGALVVGDMNIWQKSWLKHSPTNTADGERLHQVCKAHSLKQLVSEPTRGRNLLDLALSSILASAPADVLETISDHASVLVRVDIPMPGVDVLERVVWDFAHADWESLLASFENLVWDDVLRYNDPSVAVDVFSSTILDFSRRHIPRKTISERKGSHPWLDEACLRAIQRKHECSGLASFEDLELARTRFLPLTPSSSIRKRRNCVL